MKKANNICGVSSPSMLYLLQQILRRAIDSCFEKSRPKFDNYDQNSSLKLLKSNILYLQMKIYAYMLKYSNLHTFN